MMSRPEAGASLAPIIVPWHKEIGLLGKVFSNLRP
jgi:hypothetical protein